MSTIGNPGIGNIIPEAGILRETYIKKAFPAVKEVPKVPDKKSAGDNKTSSEYKKGDLQPNAGESEKIATAKPTNLKVSNKTGLGFVYDNELKKAIMRIVDEETNEVILQVPPEEVLAKIKEDLEKENKNGVSGVIVDRKV